MIRYALPEDIPSLCELELECFSRPWSRHGFEDFFSLGFTRAFVAEEEGRVVGYIGLYLSGEDVDITNIAVTASKRRSGIGKALLGAVCDIPQLKRIFLEVRESNSGAIALYEGFGFSRDGIRRNFYSDPRENAILMSYRKEG